MEPFSGQPPSETICAPCQGTIVEGEDIVGHTGGQWPCGSLYHTGCWIDWVRSLQIEGNAVSCMFCATMVTSPPVHWNRLQEELDFDFVFHEEAVWMTHTSVPYLRVSEQLQTRLHSLIDSPGVGPLLMHASFQVFYPTRIKDIEFLMVEQSEGDLLWEFNVDPAYGDGYIEFDADVVNFCAESDVQSDDMDSSDTVRQSAEEEPLDLPPKGWMPLTLDSITQWHAPIAPRLWQLHEENPHVYHGRGIQMRTHVGRTPLTAFWVEVGIERPVNDQEFPVWYHEWDFVRREDGSWAEQESEVRVRVPSDQ